MPHTAVIWSGVWNFVGVLFSTGAVAFGIVSLLPVELILQVGSGAGFAMVFALLAAAIIWNLGTWWLRAPVVELAHAHRVDHRRRHREPVDDREERHERRRLGAGEQRRQVAARLAAHRLRVRRAAARDHEALVPNKDLYKAPEGNAPPPFWIRGLLLLTCTGVSFAHGSNDGQKGMGLIMLILIGTVPTAYALNRALPASHMQDYLAVSAHTVEVLGKYAPDTVKVDDPRAELTRAVRERAPNETTIAAARSLGASVAADLARYKELKNVPPEQVRNFRNDMYLINEALRQVQKSTAIKMTTEDAAVVTNYRKHLDDATKFIPTWVKVAVALALGLGTMIGWKRIVVTVGEKIGKDHLTYAQGAAAEVTAMATIGLADHFGLPVSTTHVLSSGVAGTMSANKSGLQWSTVRNLALAWVLTLPASVVLAGGLFWLFSRFV